MQLTALQHLMRKTLRQSSGGHLRAHWVSMKLSAAYAILYIIFSELCFCQWQHVDKVYRSYYFSVTFGFVSGHESRFSSDSCFMEGTTGQCGSLSIALLSTASFVAIVTILSQPCK